MAAPQSKERAPVDARPLPEGGAWITAARQAAQARLAGVGLPQRRDEYWKFTRPDDLIAPEAPRAVLFGGDVPEVFGTVDRVRIVFVDGVFDAGASDDLALEGVRIERLAEAAAQDIHWARDLYGALEARGQAPVARPLAALNTAQARDGVLIHVTGRASKPVHLVYVHASETSDAILHHCIRLDEGAELTLFETGPAAARFNKVLEVDLAERARFDHLRIQGPDHERRAITHVFARLARETVFKSFTLAVNGVLTRNECVIEIAGDDASAHVAGAAIGGANFHHDDTVFITHDAERGESRQVFKKVLSNGATGVFQGKILVKPGAQKTDGYQISQALLLDEDSQFLAKPELEIYADDVACSHGSTSGAIDEDALYYLRARGIPRPIAADLMVMSFLAEAVAEIEDEQLREEIMGHFEAWLERRRG
ncbi:MAG: SufD family Fe-S cluster assembly protein [Roseovarius sp.]|nr:SufD family Fe-S cluster assembly protein [Roseovarius sp.]